MDAGDRIFFNPDSHELDDFSKGALRELIKWLTTNPSVTLTLEGHCDEREAGELQDEALKLGERRATAVRDFLTSFEIDPARLRTISYGRERPAIINGFGVKARNRRVVFVVN